MSTDNIDGVDTKVLPSKVLDHIKELVSERKDILRERIGKVHRYQSDARNILEMVDRSNCHLTNEETELLQTNFAQGNIIISAKVLEKFDDILERLKNDYDKWLEDVAFRYDELLIKLDDVSSKCFRKPFTNKYPSNFDPERHGEQDLIKLEKEVNERQEIYLRAQPVFDKLDEWLGCWKEKLDIQRKVCRASFYNTRGGKLDQKLKNQRQINQRLPQLFTELQEIVEKYITTNSENLSDILVEGLRADRYVQSLMDKYNNDRDMERTNKQLTVSQNTPLSNRTRNVFATPTPKFTNQTGARSPYALRTPRTPRAALQPLEQLCFNSNSKTPKSERTGRKRSLSCDDVSVIGPTKNIESGPRTSSPNYDETCTSTSSGISSNVPKQRKVGMSPSRIPRALSPKINASPGRYKPCPILPAPVTPKPFKPRPWY